MPVRTDRCERQGRARALWALLLPATLGFVGCATDICKSTNLSRAQLCASCSPKDNELLARLQPTDLPYPLRKVVMRCASDIRKSSANNVVTKQALRDCTNAEPGLDAPTKEALVNRINHSNLMEQKALDDWHSECLAGAAPAPSATTPPLPGTDAATPAAAQPKPST